MKLALFDFDGTISKQDSLIHFMRYARGDFRFFLGLFVVAPILAAYFSGLLNSHRTKELLYQHYFKHWEFEKFQALCTRYALEALPNIIRPQALKQIQWHKEQGHRVIVVSASIENYLLPWCEQLDLELLGTQLKFSETQNGKSVFTGRFSSMNCYGIEKMKRIKALLDTEAYEQIYAYGDSEGDKEMLALAHESHFKPFL